jgi:metallo-beta-lactamase family protein
MQLQFLGATGTVTGSRYLVRHGAKNVLVDCGLFQGYKELRLRNWAPLPVDPASIDAVVLTHAHIDHSGWLPLLVRGGFKGKIWCTQATLDLCRILLIDCAHLLEEEAEYANRHGTSRHRPALPLYTQQDARRCLKHFHAVRCGKSFEVVAGLQALLQPSGHMIGSAFVRLDDGHRSILFSGDIGRPEDLVLKPPTQMDGADYLVCESTYGDRLHSKSDPLPQLARIINEAAARRGVVVIPAFAVGRAQALLHCIALLKQDGRIARSLPIYLNSPMAASATEAYGKHPGELRLDAAARQALAHTAHVVGTPEESEMLNRKRGPMVIIAASGMATGGRVVHHLKAFAPQERNTLLFVGHQAGGTRGATILRGAPTVRIHGQDIPVRARVEQIDELSAHADAGEIVEWLRGFKSPPKATFITHGEPDAADAMRLRIERELGWKVHMPYYTETVALE